MWVSILIWLRSSQEQLTKKNKVLQKHQDQAEKNMDIIQDAVALDQEIDYQQQAMNDLLNQQNGAMMDGLEDEFAELGNDELMDAIGDFDATPQKNTQKQTSKKDADLDDMMKDLLS